MLVDPEDLSSSSILDSSADAISESELDKQPHQGSSDTSINIATWNIQTFNHKAKAIESFMLENNIEILAATETRHTDCKQVDSQFKRHVFLGNKYKSPVGGVGFIVRRELLDATEIDVQQGEYENSLFLTIQT